MRFEVVRLVILGCKCHSPVETGPTVYIGGYDLVAWSNHYFCKQIRTVPKSCTLCL